MSSKMISARIHEYQKSLVVESIPRPETFSDEEVLIKVGAAALYHSDLRLINGEWKDAIPLELPKIPGHENAGWVGEMGDTVPKGLFSEGELVAIFGGWGYGLCIYRKEIF
jgi:propanol-preferring alcohol dehydrogenase